MYETFKKMIPIAENMGEITELTMGDWIVDYERINIVGKTKDGRRFELTAEISKEEKKDA